MKSWHSDIELGVFLIHYYYVVPSARYHCAHLPVVDGNFVSGGFASCHDVQESGLFTIAGVAEIYCYSGSALIQTSHSGCAAENYTELPMVLQVDMSVSF